MGGKKKRSGFFFKWMKSDLPDREEKSSPVQLLAVHNNAPPSILQNRPSDSSTLPCLKHFDASEISGERPKHILTQINERFRKTLSLDSRSPNCHVYQNNSRPKSMVNSSCCSNNLPNTSKLSSKGTKKKGFRPKSFFSLETFLDSRRSDTSSADDFSSSKYCKFYLDSNECSPVLNGKITPDLLDLPNGEASIALSDEVRCKKRLDKLENHFNKIQKLKKTRHSTADSSVNSRNSFLNEESLYTEPIYEGSITSSQSTLVIGGKVDDTVNGELHNISIAQPDQIEVDHHSREKISQKSNFVKSNSYYSDKFVRERSLHDDCDMSHSSVQYCGFDLKDCSNALRNACYGNCSNSAGKSRSTGECCKERTPSSAYEIRITEDDLLINDKTKNLVVKTMDKSVDSIGSCSLDVDADNTDFSDTTSGSLNILTPSSTNTQFKDFTAKFHERATSGLRQDLRGCPLVEENNYAINESLLHPYSNISQPKKPSYLHLACSVNGYSNLTTYDSTLRQKLSRSREQSPARLGNISSFMLRNYPDDTMAQKLNTNSSNVAPNNSTTYFKTSFSETSISSQNVITYLKSNGQNVTSETTHTSKSYNVILNGSGDESPSKSFIQQRVERLYGPGALAQGFLHQKRPATNGNKNYVTSPPSRHSEVEYSYRKGQNGNTVDSVSPKTNDTEEDGETVLPVLRHLRAEFRAQLPLLSPKKSPLMKISDNTSNVAHLNTNQEDPINSRLSGHDQVDRSSDFSYKNGTYESKQPVVTIIPIKSENSSKTNKSSNGDLIPKTGVSSDSINIGDVHRPEDKSYEHIPVIKAASRNDVPINDTANDAAKASSGTEDGHYFLALCRAEMDKLEQLAVTADKELESVQNLPDVSEEVRGFLRVAAGKARLLASEKMKQFEGLCFKNLNGQCDSQFPTTIGDLRGFWDMVYLQVEDIGVLFEQVKEMKKSNWKEIPTVKRNNDATSKSSSSKGAPVKKVLKTKIESPATPKTAELAKKRDEQRKALIEAKRRAAKAQANDSVEIFAHPPPSALDKS